MELPGIVDQRAHAWAELEYSLGLCENRAGRTGLGEGQVGARQLKPDLDGQPGKAVVEQWPQPVSAVSAARASSGLASWSATRAVAACTIALMG